MKPEDIAEMNDTAKLNPADSIEEKWNKERLRRQKEEQKRIDRRMEYLRIESLSLPDRRKTHGYREEADWR